MGKGIKQFWNEYRYFLGNTPEGNVALIAQTVLMFLQIAIAFASVL